MFQRIGKASVLFNGLPGLVTIPSMLGKAGHLAQLSHSSKDIPRSHAQVLTGSLLNAVISYVDLYQSVEAF
jgi:hypothetical protein